MREDSAFRGAALAIPVPQPVSFLGHPSQTGSLRALCSVFSSSHLSQLLRKYLWGLFSLRRGSWQFLGVLHTWSSESAAQAQEKAFGWVPWDSICSEDSKSTVQAAHSHCVSRPGGPPVCALVLAAAHWVGGRRRGGDIWQVPWWEQRGSLLFA